MKIMKKILCTVLVVVLCLTSAPLGGFASDVSIPVGALEYNGNYYKVYNSSMSWTEARSYCESLGGHLVTITSSGEQGFVESLVSNNPGKKHYFIGGRRNSYGSPWYWITGEPFTYSNWGYGEDTQNLGQHYITIASSSSTQLSIFKWYSNMNYDTGTSAEWAGKYTGFICEWESSTKTVFGTLDSTNIAVEINGDEMWISEITIDGEDYAVKKKAVPLSINTYKGKDVVAIIENEEVIFCSPKEELTSDLSVSVSPYNTNISYKKKQYSADKVSLNVVLTNILSSSFDGDKSDLSDVAEMQKVISTVKLTSNKPNLVNFDGSEEYKITDLQLNTLDVGESCSASCIANINTNYKISDVLKNEVVNIKCEVAYVEEAEIKTIERSISIVFDNYNYKAATPEETKKETDTDQQTSININKNYKEHLQKVAKNLEGINALSLSYELVNNGILTEEQLKLIEQDLLCRMVMSTVPPKDFDTWLSEKVMEEIFPSTSFLGMDKYDINKTYYVDSPEYGMIEITFTTTVSKYSFKDYGISSTGDINYEIKSGVPKQYKEGFAGGGVTANVDSFCEAMSELMQSAIKSCYDKAWGDNANKVAEMVFDENIIKLISYSEYGTFSNMFYESMCYPTKKFVGKCPIDINVYDKDGNLCTSIRNNEIVLNCEKAKAEIDGDAKIIWLADEDYRIELIALGDSKMDVTIEEYANSSGLIRSVNIDDIELEYGKTYVSDVEKSLLCDTASYNILSSNNKVFEVDEIIDHLHSHTFGEWHTVSEETCTEYGKKINECLTCGRTVVGFILPTGHNYEKVVTDPTCVEKGKTVYTCSCGETYTETIEGAGHNFDGSVCKNCGYDKSDDCSCNCHAGGIKKFFFKFLLFFQKIFRTNKECKCGIKHY